MEQNMEAKLKVLLKQEKIQLWNPPYTQEGNQPGTQHMQELAERYVPLVGRPVEEVGGALESVRLQAVTRGRGNQTFRETKVATLELLLPRDMRQEPKKKTYLETRLDVPAQTLVDRIAEEFGLRNIKLILNGKTLSVELPLDLQAVSNHSKVMILRLSESDWKHNEEEEKKRKESLQRSQKGFRILSERDGSEDPDSSPFLEVADQKGNPLKIPPNEKKALILAMGLHEKGRSLMKKKLHDVALIHLLQADLTFSECGSALLSSVDNFAVLQLDIVWCYWAIESLSCLDDARTRLKTAEQGLARCYGEKRERLQRIQGNTGREEVLFLRLRLLQSLLSYIEGNDAQTRQQLSSVESLFSLLSPDSASMARLMDLGFSERECRLGLRACRGNLEEAANHISSRRQEKEELRQRELQKRRTNMASLSTLTQLGFSRKDSVRALQRADGDPDRAYAILLDSTQINNNNPEGPGTHKVEQLLYLGFQREAALAALSLTGGDVQEATQLLLDHQGVVPPELLSPSSPPSTSSPSSPPSTSLSSSPSSEEPAASTSAEDAELVNELLDDLPRHEEDYLDLTLEEEAELIATIRAYLSHTP